MSNSGIDLNAAPRPRVLLQATAKLAVQVLPIIEEFAGTVKHVAGLYQVDPEDWDAIITDTRPSGRASDKPRVYRNVPTTMNVIYLQSPDSDIVDKLFDFLLLPDDTFAFTLFETAGVPGTRAERVEGLPDDLQSLVVRELAPLVASRHRQWGHLFNLQTEASALPHNAYRPFLLGPQSMVYAASYRRADRSHAWVLPTDLPDFRPWIEMAFREWHEDDPERFPAAPGWLESPDWYTRKEADAAAAVDAEVARFAPTLEKHQTTLHELEAALQSLKLSTAAGERLLLSGQGDALQVEVQSALVELGFAVEDMDAQWDPRERREDYRIADPDEPGWMVIADATGTTKGVKGAKLMILGRFVAKYLAENSGASVPGQWLLANHFIERDPNVRPTNLLRADELAAFRESDGLVIDTAALFTVLQAVRERPHLAPLLRGHLRQLRGEFGLADARSWVSEQSDT